MSRNSNLALSLPRRQAEVLGVLRDRAGRDGLVSVSQAEIASAAGLNRRNVPDLLNRLERKGAVRAFPARNSRSRRVYRVVAPIPGETKRRRRSRSERVAIAGRNLPAGLRPVDRVVFEALRNLSAGKPLFRASFSEISRRTKFSVSACFHAVQRLESAGRLARSKGRGRRSCFVISDKGGL